MEAKIIKQDNTMTVIEWHSGVQFGQLVIKYNGKGGYEMDAEYIGMDKVINIFKAIKQKL